MTRMLGSFDMAAVIPPTVGAFPLAACLCAVGAGTCIVTLVASPLAALSGGMT